MPTVTISSKNQITLPAQIVRELGLRGGDKLVVELIDDRLVIVPEPESWVDYFAGSMKGVYGDTKEEVDRYIAEVRHGYEIGALADALSLDPTLRAVYDATSSEEARSQSRIAQMTGVERGDVGRYLERLQELEAVKRLAHPERRAEAYYRRLP